MLGTLQAELESETSSRKGEAAARAALQGQVNTAEEALSRLEIQYNEMQIVLQSQVRL